MREEWAGDRVSGAGVRVGVAKGGVGGFCCFHTGGWDRRSEVRSGLYVGILCVCLDCRYVL